VGCLLRKTALKHLLRNTVSRWAVQVSYGGHKTQDILVSSICTFVEVTLLHEMGLGAQVYPTSFIVRPRQKELLEDAVLIHW
jgi:hypothetical protein